MGKKCACGYEPKFPNEFDMLETWGCAKATIKQQGFGRTVVLCSTTDRSDDAENIEEDPQTIQDAYKNMVDNNKPKPDGTK